MNEKQQVMADAKVIEECMKKYTGKTGAHFGFIACESGSRQFITGGRVDLLGNYLAEGIARIVNITPQLQEFDFIDRVCLIAKKMLKEMQKGGKPQ